MKRLLLLLTLIGTLSACGGPQTPAQYREAIQNATSVKERLAAMADMMDFANLITKNHDEMSAQDFANWRKQHEVTDDDLATVLHMNAAFDAIHRYSN